MDYFKFDFMAHETSNTERYAEIKVCSSISHRLTTMEIGLFHTSVKRSSLKIRHTLHIKPLVLGVLLCIVNMSELSILIKEFRKLRN